MKKLWKPLISALLICTMVAALSVTTFAAKNTSTSWDNVDGDTFKVVTTKKNARVTVQVQKTKNFLGMYPMDAIKVKFTPSGTAKAVTAKTGWYAVRPSAGLKTYTIVFKDIGSHYVDVDLASGMDRFLSGGEVEWRVKSCTNASLE